MPVKLSDLRLASWRRPVVSVARSLLEAKALRQRSVFLCHSSEDRDLARGVQTFLADHGLTVYVDWEDTTMPDTPSGETAEKIRRKIREMDWLMFLATPNSTKSRWCPWEIGYADGAKSPSAIIVIPTADDSGKYYGNEYLQLYRRIDLTRSSKVELFEAGMQYTSTPLNNL